VQDGISTLEVKRVTLCWHMEQRVVSWCWWYWLHVLECHLVCPQCVSLTHWGPVTQICVLLRLCITILKNGWHKFAF
jgi:hypothetical protein